MARTGNQTYKYAAPDPFTVPTIEARPQQFDDPGLQAIALLLPFDIFPHEQLLYSGPIIENIMFNLNREFEFRDQPPRQWKAYKSGTDDFDTFVPIGNTEGVLRKSTLSDYPVEWFPLYIKDMQDAITELLTLGGIPDDIGSAMARIFGNYTTAYGNRWDGTSVIRPQYRFPAPTSDGSNTNTILYSPDLSKFPFPYDSAVVKDAGSIMGIDFRGEAYVQRGKTGIITSDTEWPRSVIGKVRTEQDVTIKEGELVESEGKSVEGIDGIHVKMKAAGRPEQERKISEADAPLPGAVGLSDPESGYGWFSHHPLVLHQCRYQPPLIETWSAKTEIRDWVENAFSNLTPNLPWYFSQPVEKQHFADWGGWIIQGRGGLTGSSITSEAYADPQYDNIITNCPYSVFYPPPSSNCSCGAANAAYAIWTSSAEPLIWNLRTWFNFGRSAGLKFFGPKTRMRISGTVSLSAGVGGEAGFFIGIRTIRVGANNLQPFVPIIALGSFADQAAAGGSFDVNIMEGMQKHYPFYEKAGLDAIMSIQILCNTTTSASAVVQAQDGPGGSFIPDTDLGCAIGTSSFDLNYLHLYEPPLSFGDERLPTPDTQSLTPPPDYPYPKLSGGPSV